MKKISYSSVKEYVTSKGCRAWWARWSSAFVATVCGIVVTLGTNAWIQSNAKEAKARRAVEMMLLSLNEQSIGIRQSVETILEADSIINALTEQYAQGELSEQTCQQVYSIMAQFVFSIPWNTAKGIYDTSFDFWLAIDNPSALEAMGQALFLEETFYKITDNLQQEREEVFKLLNANGWKDDYPDCTTMMKEWLKAPQMQRFLKIHNGYSEMLSRSVIEEADLLEFLCDELDISNERLLELRTKYDPQQDLHVEVQ
ncbi:MAG: hypothetical protein LUD17_06920 [Bacteroidales bacterium]|nr:hypothetical protein [Bacteroidales bacterium]